MPSTPSTLTIVAGGDCTTGDRVNDSVNVCAVSGLGVFATNVYGGMPLLDTVAVVEVHETDVLGAGYAEPALKLAVDGNRRLGQVLVAPARATRRQQSTSNIG
jgi:hypothetical protein